MLEYLPPEADAVLIAANPKAGPRSGEAKIAALANVLGQGGFRVEVITDLEVLTRRAEEERSAGKLRAVVAAGGDGTISELANRTSSGTPLTVLPLGTENLLAKYFGLIRTPDKAARTIAEGATVQLDAAKAGGRIFLLMAGVGFDADVVRRLHESRRGNIRHLSYFKPIVRSIRSYAYPELRLYCRTSCADGAEQLIRARWAFVTNLPRYAARLRIAPHALGTDGLLDVCSFRRGSLWHGLRYLLCVVAGRHACLADCATGRVTHVRIEADEPVPYQLDGDPGGVLPVEIEVLPRHLTFVVPVEWGRANGFSANGSMNTK